MFAKVFKCIISDENLDDHSYRKKINHGGQNVLTEAVFRTTSVERSRSIVALTEVVQMPTSVNQIKKQKKKPMDKSSEPIHTVGSRPLGSAAANEPPFVKQQGDACTETECCKRIFRVFQMFQRYVANVLY
jgi:hypothetical protein